MNDTRKKSNGSAGFVPLFSSGVFAPAGTVTAEQSVASVADDPDFFASTVEDEKKAAYKQGLADGEARTLEAMSGKLDEQIERWRVMLGRLAADVRCDLDAFLAMAEERTVAVSVAIAEKLVEKEIQKAPELVAERLRGALAVYRAEDAVRVRANPKDAVFLKRLVGSPADPPDGDAPRDPVVALVEDDEVKPGGFVVETPAATFDHTMRSQLIKLESELAGLYERTDT